MGVCALHWPEDVQLVRRKDSRHFFPAVPPSIFPNVPESCIPSAENATPRSTKKAQREAMVTGEDEMEKFRELDKIKADAFKDKFQEKAETIGLFAADQENTNIAVISKQRNGPIPLFALYLVMTVIGDVVTLQFEAFRNIRQVFHPTIKGAVKCWSELDELLRFLTSSEPEIEPTDSRKETFISNQIKLFNVPQNSCVYSTGDISLALSWYSNSRALYTKIGKFLQMPSVSTLGTVTRLTKSLDGVSLFKSVFANMEERCRSCVLIIDEVYVKASLTYRGGSIFGYAADCPGKLATTLLCIMVKCFFGSKTFLAKILPCHALTAAFQHQAVTEVKQSPETSGVKVLGLINDNNRIKQSFFKMFTALDINAPWIVQSPVDPSRPLFLLFDPVHIFKNIRNSWITEKTQTFKFDHQDSICIARWSDLKSMQEYEETSLLKLSSLTRQSINPTNIEKQKVCLALNVFSEKTSAALKTSSISNNSMTNTAAFIDLVIKLWKVFNCETT